MRAVLLASYLSVSAALVSPAARTAAASGSSVARARTAMAAVTADGATGAATPSVDLYDPAVRNTQYASNIAQYLVDLHDSHATFDFCGGMMFELELSPVLREKLLAVAQNGGTQPVVHDSATPMMRQGGHPATPSHASQ